MKTIYKNRASSDSLRLHRANKYNNMETPRPSQEITKEGQTVLDQKIADMIIKTVSSKFNVSYEDMQLEKKPNEIVIPRQLCMTLIKDKTKMTYKQVGDLFGKDHATCWYAKNRAIPTWLTEPSFRVEFDEVSTLVKLKVAFITNTYNQAS